MWLSTVFAATDAIEPDTMAQGVGLIIAWKMVVAVPTACVPSCSFVIVPTCMFRFIENSEVDWKPLRTSNPWVIDFTEIDPGTQRVIYVTAHVHSDREREVVFAMGSDDGLRVRVNDDLVHEKAVMRGLNRGEDKVKVTLREGTNIIEAKIAQGGGGWGFCLRIENENGQPAEGLQVLSW